MKLIIEQAKKETTKTRYLAPQKRKTCYDSFKGIEIEIKLTNLTNTNKYFKITKK